MHVQVTGETILVTRATGHDWQVLKGPIAAAIRAVLDSTDQPLGDGAATPATAKRDAKLLAAISELLDAKTNPSIASHGGHVSAESVENGIVHLRMAGGCQGCAASAVTLRQGVETMLRAALPTIREIVDVTDHASGQTPFYGDKPGQSPVFRRLVPADVLAWEEGQLRIAPTYVAPRLGLKPEDLQAGFSRGEIVMETGPGPQSEATRVIVRGPTLRTCRSRRCQLLMGVWHANWGCSRRARSARSLTRWRSRCARIARQTGRLSRRVS
ncbi:NifU family protein [Rhodobacteraceae bacterium LMO-12]|nr:NifU family protein [Rhodobacteraceae bacterium LMO-JJ12]